MSELLGGEYGHALALCSLFALGPWLATLLVVTSEGFSRYQLAPLTDTILVLNSRLLPISSGALRVLPNGRQMRRSDTAGAWVVRGTGRTSIVGPATVGSLLGAACGWCFIELWEKGFYATGMIGGPLALGLFGGFVAQMARAIGCIGLVEAIPGWVRFTRGNHVGVYPVERVGVEGGWLTLKATDGEVLDVILPEAGLPSAAELFRAVAELPSERGVESA